MATGIYIGGSMPKYVTTTETINITAGNISAYFTVSNNSYYFVGNGSVFTTNNGGVANSTAKTTLTAKQNMSNITFNYSYSSEANYDKFTLTVAGTVIENAVSGATTTKSYSGTLSAGDTIIFQYAKDVSADRNDDKCTFSDITISITTQEQDGFTDNVAKIVKQGYLGHEGVAKRIAAGYIGKEGVARSFLEKKIYWEKYQCYKTTIYKYTQTSYSDTSPVSFSKSMEYNSDYSQTIVGIGYKFSSANGYQYNSEKYISITSSATLSWFQSALVGNSLYNLGGYKFETDPFQVVSITSITHNSGYVTINGTMKRVGKATATVQGYAYRKNGTAIGIIGVPEGELPENGNLIDGSVSGEYCVLSGLPGSTWGQFYYLKVEAPVLPIVTWYKYSCNATGYFSENEPYTATYNHSFAYGEGEVGSQYLYTGYSFSSSGGYSLSGRTARYVTTPSISALNAAYVGYYGGGTTTTSSEVYRFDNVVSVSSTSGNFGYMRVQCTYYGTTFHPTSLSQGSTLLSTINALQGEKPESSYTLVEGSVLGPYCVLFDSGNDRYFYYTTTAPQ